MCVGMVFVFTRVYVYGHNACMHECMYTCMSYMSALYVCLKCLLRTMDDYLLVTSRALACMSALYV